MIQRPAHKVYVGIDELNKTKVYVWVDSFGSSMSDRHICSSYYPCWISDSLEVIKWDWSPNVHPRHSAGSLTQSYSVLSVEIYPCPWTRSIKL